MKRMIASSLAQAQASVGLKPPHEIEVVVEEAAYLRETQAHGQQDPYVFMYASSNKELYHATKVCMNSDIFGKWDETFRIACNAVTDTLVVEVRNRTAAALGSLGSVVSGGKSGDVIIGRCQLPLSSLLAGAPVNGWFALDSGGGVKLGLKLVYATPGSVPASYAITPLPVLAAAPGSSLAGQAGKSGVPPAPGPYPQQQMMGTGYPQQQQPPLQPGIAAAAGGYGGAPAAGGSYGGAPAAGGSYGGAPAAGGYGGAAAASSGGAPAAGGGYGGAPTAGSGGGGAYYPMMPGGASTGGAPGAMAGAPGATGGALPYAGHPGTAGGGAGGQQPYMAGTGAYPYPAPAPGMPAMGPGGVAAKATYPGFPTPGAPAAAVGVGSTYPSGQPAAGGAYPGTAGAPPGSAYPSLAGMPGAPASTAGRSAYPPTY